MDVDGGVELWASLVQVDDGLHWQRSCALRSIEGEIPPLTARLLTLESQGAGEQHSEGTL